MGLVLKLFYGALLQTESKIGDTTSYLGSLLVHQVLWSPLVSSEAGGCTEVPIIVPCERDPIRPGLFGKSPATWPILLQGS